MSWSFAAEDVAADGLYDADSFMTQDKWHRFCSLSADSVQIAATDCSGMQLH
eukprot:CAMPEP_0178372558 /NCGR_PEP_ID=MMETSP0689_2-20121128/1414_1 /TAXON_ID=160604 /ORGANISM="Amphidinium massartii, Strain CS-259" /LENGTH=51 /DNA_ID=CAMNT_0019992483 /DNA_START=830 /DNA_END=985 /DNA_ORIENTATION=-